MCVVGVILEREMESVAELMGQADVKYYSVGRRDQKTEKEDRQRSMRDAPNGSACCAFPPAWLRKMTSNGRKPSQSYRLSQACPEASISFFFMQNGTLMRPQGALEISWTNSYQVCGGFFLHTIFLTSVSQT